MAILEKFWQLVLSLLIPPELPIESTEPPVYLYPLSLSMEEFPFEFEITTVVPPEKSIPDYDVVLLESSPSPRAYT